MATYIHLTSKDIIVDELFAYEIVMLCVRDFQICHNLHGNGDLTKPNGLVPDGDTLLPLIEELADECETLIQAKDSTYKWSLLIHTLMRHQRVTPCPHDTIREHYIDNPLMCHKRIVLGDWTIESDGIYNSRGKGFFIPKRWLFVFSYDYLEAYINKEISPKSTEEKFDALTLLSMLESELAELNSRSSKDRSQEIKRKLDNLAKVVRTVMEECEDDG